MKAYIHEPIIITNEGCDETEWKNLLDRFEKFDKDWCIFNKRDAKTITIQDQKINLDEENMSEFLWYLHEITFCYGLKTNSDYRLWDYRPEMDRITVTINVQYHPLREGYPKGAKNES